jgi:hypothetical protein
MGIARIGPAVVLQRAEVIGIAELGAQLLEDRPIALLPLMPDLAFEMALEVGANTVVVEQRVVDIEQENHALLHSAVLARAESQTRSCPAP